MAGLLVVGLLLVHVADRGGTKVSQDEALAIARPRIDFKPTGHQIRFIRRGIPPRGFWVVSFYIRKPLVGLTRVTVVLVDATTGRVTEVRRTT
jgi:hypothetical protein